MLLLGACTESVEYFGRPAHELHGKRVLLLRPSLLTPTGETLNRRVVDRIEAAMESAPELGGVVDGTAVRQRGDLRLRDAYDLYSNTLSLTGVSDPDLARVLGERMGVELLAVAQPAYLPCSVCEEGDRMYLVGQWVDASTGRIVVRVHINAPAPDSNAEALTQVADALTADYLDSFHRAFRLRPHRQRFENLKRMAGG